MQDTRSRIIDLGHGISREALYDEHLIIYTANDAKRETIDTWHTDVTTHMKSYQPGATYAMMYDFSHPNAILTSYARSRAVEVARLVPKTNMNYAAIITQGGFVGQTYQMFMRMIGNAAHLQTRIFFNREQGLNWLTQKLTEADAKK
jgi:hypothetical protein